MILIKVADPSISQPMSHMRCFEVAWSNLRHNINKLTGLIQQLTEQEPLFKLHENETRSGWTVAELLLESCFNPYLGPLAQSFTQGEAVCPLWSPCSSAKKKQKNKKKNNKQTESEGFVIYFWLFLRFKMNCCWEGCLNSIFLFWHPFCNTN